MVNSDELCQDQWGLYATLRMEAADELDRLTAENERLKADLRAIKEIAAGNGEDVSYLLATEALGDSPNPAT